MEQHPPRTKRLTAAIRSRVTPPEKELLAAVAQDSGSTLSQWLRRISLDAAGCQAPEVKRLLANIDGPDSNEAKKA